ncbi:hypothetical protein ACIOMM_34815 [Streptomyces sp. NPDC087908]|uniref:hypothetical protein n=1 Tax=Streptomyces sp. NPDC087908 TaxID=3365820 RepID=UPI0037F324C2
MRMKTRRTAALGTVALLCGSLGLTGHAQAAEPKPYLVLVEWTKYTPAGIDDCEVGAGCDTAEAFGTLASHTTATGSRASGIRMNFGEWEPKATCQDYSGLYWEWAGDTRPYNPHKDCLKRVTTGTAYEFKKTMMCKSDSWLTCDTGKAKNNNATLLKVYPGDKIRLAAHFRDYDRMSSSDDICNVTQFTEALTTDKLRSLNRTGRMVDSSHLYTGADGGCIVDYKLTSVAAPSS